MSFLGGPSIGRVVSQTQHSGGMQPLANASASFAVTAVVPPGLEEAAAAELTRLGAADVRPLRRAVACRTDLTGLYRLHLQARLVRLDLGCVKILHDPATSLLEPLARPTAAGADAVPLLQDAAVPWLPFARLLHARLSEQRRLEEQVDRQSLQLREQQRRLEQLGAQLDALRAIERSLNTRPAVPAPAAPRP